LDPRTASSVRDLSETGFDRVMNTFRLLGSCFGLCWFLEASGRAPGSPTWGALPLPPEPPRPGPKNLKTHTFCGAHSRGPVAVGPAGAL
jgi:hypothetical protein